MTYLTSRDVAAKCGVTQQTLARWRRLYLRHAPASHHPWSSFAASEAISWSQIPAEERRVANRGRGRKPIAHNWSKSRCKVPREEVLTALADTSRTIPEIAASIGMSRNWCAVLAAMHSITRPRGGDRRSPAARARFERKTAA